MAISGLLHVARERALQADLQHLLIGVVWVPVLYLVVNEIIRSKARISQLKGPAGLPLIGNLHQIRTNAAEQYRKWAKRYGGVYQIQLGNIPIVVINTAAAAKVIFGQHSQALSSRPEFYTFHKVGHFRFDRFLP
jgi:3-hydroxyphenylacetate 6-hydroxylase